MYSNNLVTIPCFGIIENLDNIKSYGEGYIYNNRITGYPEGHIFAFFEAVKGVTIQFYFSYTGTYRMTRLFNWATEVWTEWKSF